MDFKKIINDVSFMRVIQSTYFNLNPKNPNVTESHYQELLIKNLNIIYNFNISQEISSQKKTTDINGEILSLRNKTQRYDLLIDDISTIFELKNLADITDESRNQLLHYLTKKKKYKYGILINFMKSNKKKLVAQVEVFEKGVDYSMTDIYNDHYSNYHYELIKSFETENYNDYCLNYTKKDDNIIEIK